MIQLQVVSWSACPPPWFFPGRPPHLGVTSTNSACAYSDGKLSIRPISEASRAESSAVLARSPVAPKADPARRRHHLGREAQGQARRQSRKTGVSSDAIETGSAPFGHFNLGPRPLEGCAARLHFIARMRVPWIMATCSSSPPHQPEGRLKMATTSRVPPPPRFVL
jgi:hypothetical protein